LFHVFDLVRLFDIEIIGVGLSSLEVSPSFLNSFSFQSLLSQYQHHLPPLSILFCCLSMPPARESFNSVKTRLARKQKTRTRTERRVRALLQPSLTKQDAEISDDSEEENRISARLTRLNRDKATQTDISSSSFCCGVIVGVFVVVSLLVCLVFFSENGRQSLAKKRGEGAEKKSQTKRKDLWAAF
jgi:hypothetical protein